MRKFFAAAAISLVATLAIAQTAKVAGEVTKIDEPQAKITLKHGPIKNLDMDGMTMAFAVGDPAVLKKLKVGDKVLFEADRVNGRLTVTKIDKAK